MNEPLDDECSPLYEHIQDQLVWRHENNRPLVKAVAISFEEFARFTRHTGCAIQRSPYGPWLTWASSVGVVDIIPSSKLTGRQRQFRTLDATRADSEVA